MSTVNGNGRPAAAVAAASDGSLRGFDGTVERVGDRLSVIAPRGELDAYSYEAFRDEALAASVGDVVVDLTEVSFIDSLSLGTIAQASRRVRARGDELRLVCPHTHMRKVIEVTGLARLMPVERSLADAVAHALAR